MLERYQNIIEKLKKKYVSKSNRKTKNSAMSERFQNLIGKHTENTTMSERFQNLIGKHTENTTMSERFQHIIKKQNIPHCRGVSKIELKNKTTTLSESFLIMIEKTPHCLNSSEI
jgi:hypothetical protein